jgi:hypothetical protein
MGGVFMVLKIIIWVLILNFVTCLFARLKQGGRFVYDRKVFPDYNGKMIFIAGLLDQPDHNYEGMSMPYLRGGNLRFSLFGFNPKNSGEQLTKITRPKDYIVGASIGCKAILYSVTCRNKRVFINPATHSIAFIAKYQTMSQFLSPIAELISYALGWLSILPVITTKNNAKYSFALLADQFFWCYYGDPTYDQMKMLDRTGVIISTDDEYLENDVVKSIYSEAKDVVSISTRHAFFSNPFACEEYQNAINKLLS